MTGPELVVGDPGAQGMSADRLARIRPWMEGYVAAGKLPGALTLVARRGEVVFLDAVGRRDVEEALALELDTLFRIYSMTKPVTSVAMLMLYEEGRFQLDDPLARYAPRFADLRVYTGGGVDDYQTEPLERPVTLHDLFTHTSGFTYDLLDDTVVAELYRQHRVRHVAGNHTPPEFLARLAEVPLVCQPGAQWNYSVSTDVLGCLLEIIADEPFDDFLARRVFGPLGMVDTGFWVPPDKQSRLAASYARGEEGGLELADRAPESAFCAPRAFNSGGGGLVSTAGDYFRFAQMLANRGVLDGARLLGRRTVEYMTMNHLPGDLAAMGQPRFAETSFEGIGFGLGVSVVIDPPRTQVLQSPGTYAWGGMASTAFWVDPVEDVVAVFLTQLQPSWSYPLRAELRVLVNQAVVD